MIHYLTWPGKLMIEENWPDSLESGSGTSGLLLRFFEKGTKRSKRSLQDKTRMELNSRKETTKTIITL
jgi:hypothetical protein